MHLWEMEDLVPGQGQVCKHGVANWQMQALLEEYGKWLNVSLGADMTQRDRYFQLVYEDVKALVGSHSALKVRACLSRPHRA